MDTTKIIIDNREPKDLIEYIKSKTKSPTTSVVRPMDVGDYAIYEKDTPSIIFERKSLNDLVASIKDGRYNEQSARLNSISLHNHNIIYIIEGDITRYKDENTQKMIYSAIFTMSYHKGFSIINSLNKIQTAEYILHFFDKYCREKTKRTAFYHPSSAGIPDYDDSTSNNNTPCNIPDTDYCSLIKTSKKANITRDNILQIMLMQIPSISEKCAEAICAKFPNLETLLTVLRDEPEKLDELRFIDTNRKISKTARENLSKYLLS